MLNIMKILVLMDSFKGSLTSMEAGQAVKEGISGVDSQTEVAVYPFADGGEGTLDAFLAADKNSKKTDVIVSDPLGRMVKSGYGILGDGTAVIEMAGAAGLCLLKDEERNPLHTTTRGVGELIKHAVEHGCRRFIVAIGGSATNDCGTGMLSELGCRILDESGRQICDGALGLKDAASIDTEKMLPELKECSFVIASDVKNPLYGERGASRIFAPQKGASPDDVEFMDEWMRHFSDIVKRSYTGADPMAEGAGAAGGMGYALQIFLGGVMEPGADVLLKRTDIEKEIKSSDLIITGEGRIDSQTAMGKAPARIAAAAKKYNKPVIAICGCMGEGVEKCHDIGIDAIFPIVSGVMTLKEAMKKETAFANLKRTSEEVIRTWRILN